MSSPKNLKLGTRGSKLALTQARFVADCLRQQNPALNIQMIPITTSGDRFRGERLAEAGGKGLFVKEIEEALLRGKIDLAVHSLKDLPALLPEALTLAAFPKRQDPRDCLVSGKARSLAELPKGASVGTGSPRRTLQLLSLRPDLNVQPIRGNVETRLKKLEEGKYDALILAAAGLKRLGLERHISAFLDPAVFLPAAGQGILAVEIRRAEEALGLWLGRHLSDPKTETIARAERAFSKTIGGDCYTPLAVFCRREDSQLRLTGWLASPDGKKQVRREQTGPPDQGETVGKTLAKELLDAMAHHTAERPSR